jgi:hypothetical protein
MSQAYQREDDFADTIREIVRALKEGKDLSSYSYYDVAAAKIILKDQTEFEKEASNASKLTCSGQNIKPL